MVERNGPEGARGFVYVVGCEAYVKIGIAGDVRSRIGLMQIGNPFPIKLLNSWQMDKPLGIERGLHGALDRYRVRGEWFKLPDDIHASLASASTPKSFFNWFYRRK